MGFAPDGGDRKKSFDSSRSADEYKEEGGEISRRPSTQADGETTYSDRSLEKRRGTGELQLQAVGDTATFSADSGALHYYFTRTAC
jgi:hypothetical protein